MPTAGPSVPNAAASPSQAVGAQWERHRAVLEAILALGAGLLAVYRLAERDFWFHLAAGRSILENGLPSQEPWCLAAYGQWPWLGEWIFHVALYTVYSAAGDMGVAIWRAGWAAFAMLMAFLLARAAGAGILVTALVTPVVLAVSRERFLARPEQISLAFVLLFLVAFEWARRSKRDWTPFLLIPQILWANAHPMWVLGPLVSAAYAAFSLLPGRERDLKRAAKWGILAIVLFASAGVSPRPIDTWTLRIVRDATSDPAVGAVEELKSWSAEEDLFGQYSGVLILCAVALALGGRRLWRSSPVLVTIAISTLATGLAIYRFRGLAAFIALPVIASGLTLRGPPQQPAPARAGSTKKGPRPAQARRRSRRGRQRLGFAIGALAAVGGIVWLTRDTKMFEVGAKPLLRSVPVRAVALADSLALNGPVFNTSWYGGYILWIRGEEHLPLQDTRFLGPPDFRSLVYRASFQRTSLDTLMADWNFTHAILTPPLSEHDRVNGYLFHHPDWKLVHTDDAGQLFVRSELLPDLAEDLGYDLLSPDYAELGSLASQAVRDTVLEAALVAELQRAVASSPWNSRAHLWLGIMALGTQDPGLALQHFADVERLAPATPGLALRQGLAHEMLGERAQAIAAYRRALDDTTEAASAEELLRRLGEQ